MSEQAQMPEPCGMYEEDFYDIARWIPEEDDFELEDYSPGHFWTKAEAIAWADKLNADLAAQMKDAYDGDLYVAVLVERRVEYRKIKDTDR